MGVKLDVPEHHALAVAAAQGELAAICEKYRVRLAVVEVKVDGQTRELSVQFVPSASTLSSN